MKYKLFISDFDGTLGRAPDYISQEDINAIKEYAEYTLSNKVVASCDNKVKLSTTASFAKLPQRIATAVCHLQNPSG